MIIFEFLQDSQVRSGRVESDAVTLSMLSFSIYMIMQTMLYHEIDLYVHMPISIIHVECGYGTCF